MNWLISSYLGFIWIIYRIYALSSSNNATDSSKCFFILHYVMLMISITCTSCFCLDTQYSFKLAPTVITGVLYGIFSYFLVYYMANINSPQFELDVATRKGFQCAEKTLLHKNKSTSSSYYAIMHFYKHITVLLYCILIPYILDIYHIEPMLLDISSNMHSILVKNQMYIIGCMVLCYISLSVDLHTCSKQRIIKGNIEKNNYNTHTNNSNENEMKKNKKIITKNIKEKTPEGWYHICPSSKLSQGEIMTVRVCGIEIVVFRENTNLATIHAIDAYCPHLGAHLGHGGKIKDDCIQCPFHFWEIHGESGIVKNIPYSKGNKIPSIAKSQIWKTKEEFGSIWLLVAEDIKDHNIIGLVDEHQIEINKCKRIDIGNTRNVNNQYIYDCLCEYIGMKGITISTGTNKLNLFYRIILSLIYLQQQYNHDNININNSNQLCNKYSLSFHLLSSTLFTVSCSTISIHPNIISTHCTVPYIGNMVFIRSIRPSSNNTCVSELAYFANGLIARIVGCIIMHGHVIEQNSYYCKDNKIIRDWYKGFKKIDTKTLEW